MLMSRFNGRVVGLTYDEANGDAPEISLKAEGELSARVLRWARRCGVPIVEEPGLAADLSRLEMDEAVPRELFRPVALLLASLRKHLPVSKKS